MWSLGEDETPIADASAWTAPTSTVVGRVRLHADSSVWYGAVLRAEHEPIIIGSGTNVQDGVVAHTDPDFPLTVGKDVSIGHNAVLHGCTIGDGSLIGMGAVVMNGAVIGNQCLIAAGALVPEGVQIPAHSLVAGVPAKIRRKLRDDEIDHCIRNAGQYRELAKQHREASAVRPLPA